MQTAQISTKILQESFKWFEDRFSPAVKQGSEEFWESEFDFRLFSLTTNEAVKKDIISRGETYFITQLSINSHHQATFRISSEFVRIYLHSFLGSVSTSFKLIDLTELEVKILNAFSEFLLRQVQKNFTPYEAIPKAALKDKGEYHLTFFARKDNGKGSKIVLSVPKCVLSPQAIARVESFALEDFEKMSTFVNIRAGMTKIALNDLKSLSIGDIILLEYSNIHKMFIKTGNIEREFRVNPNPSLIIELDEDEHDTGGEAVTDKNIWDDIQIEVAAEFKKVKMTLGELKQISSGLVVDLGSAFDSKISLVVENKMVARGELVIINDHYGVRLDEVFANPALGGEPVPAEKPLQAQAHTAPRVEEVAAKIQEAPQEEDFDYSDFENDD